MIGDARPSMPNTRVSIAQKEKTEMCKYVLLNTKCPFDGRCSFAHHTWELRMIDCSNGKYKTKKCKNFHQGIGFCPYGSKCRYIHAEISSYLDALHIYQQFDLADSWQDAELVAKQLPTRLAASCQAASDERRLAHILH